MSAEAARIISKISGRKQISGFEPMLGTVSAISPLTIKFDDVGFDVSAGLLVNASFMGHKRMGDITSPVMDLPDSEIEFKGALSAGDRVVGVAVGGTHYVILCKVVPA